MAAILVACLAPSLAWLGYFYLRGEYARRPLENVLLAFGTGMLAGPLALLLFSGIERVAFYRHLGRIDLVPDRFKLLYAIFAVGLVEEVSKLLVCVWVLRRRGIHARAPVDGVLYSAATALGFATIENWYAMLAQGAPVWSRAITQPFNHVLFSALWGVALGASIGPQGPRGLVSLGLVLAISYHGLYDYIVLAESVSDVWLAPLVLLLWVWFGVAARRAIDADALPVAEPRLA